MAEGQQISFKERVRNAAIQHSKDYFSQYVSRDYLVFSDAFHSQPYYIISAEKSNYLHLVGVSTNLSASDFFEKCFNGTLSENDFEISSHGQDAKASKGAIRRKINALPAISGLISTSNLIEESFQKNSVSCTIASSDGSCTLGFIAVPKARPKTLLSGDELDHSKAAPIKVILSKDRSTAQFSSVQSGNLEDLVPQYESIKTLLSEELRSKIEALILKQDESSGDSCEDTEQPAESSQSLPPNIDDKESSES